MMIKQSSDKVHYVSPNTQVFICSCDEGILALSNDGCAAIDDMYDEFLYDTIL